MKKQHNYSATIEWTGNLGRGTLNYRAFERSHSVSVEGKPYMLCSSDPAFRGDNTKYNPEELLLASLSSCHMLWYLHLCAENGIVVTDYVDKAKGTMLESVDGSGRFETVNLYPKVTVLEKSMIKKAEILHKKANEMCFIANSVNFEVFHHPKISIEE
ncbi:OsmC family protein [Costertonia aggregata]|uniref:OsmC family protein n=1 Tax=Costertonia aggregata TaxID=343403 RepID=A0A7H9AMM4_9FLAO|nr:OsmC family protein [Costertonia aggregata]QLG44700.1 OsmC family protein [Costertonia aggregata]